MTARNPLRADQDHGHASDAFFAQLASTPHPLLKRVRGTVRVDLRDGQDVEHWHLTIDEGSVKVSRRNLRADGAIITDKASFDEMATGSRNAMAAQLRGELVVEGDLAIIMAIWRLFPGPSGAPTLDLREQEAATTPKPTPRKTGRRLAGAGRARR